MCKEFPGPRCSNHARITLEKAHRDLVAAKALNSAGSLEVKTAERSHYEALESYRATPDGLEQLAAEQPSLVVKYQKMRDYQIEALNEIRSERFSKISSLVTSSQSFFEEEEVLAITESVRRMSEKSHISRVENSDDYKDLSSEEKKHHYLSILNQYENRLREVQRNTLTSDQMDTLTSLRAQKPPKEITSLETYSQAFLGAVKAREVMRKEIQRISVLQDVSSKVAAAYHDAYRKEFQQKYATLPVKEQPNPPKEWVEGRFATTGFQNDMTTRLAPSDAATMYATYRLRADMNAIPDYLKNSRNIATLSVENNEVNIILCNSKGKEIENTSIPLTDTHDASEKLRGRIIVLGGDNETKDWLVSLSKKSNLKSSILPTTEFSSKHLCLPDNSITTFRQATNTQGSEPEAKLTMNAYLTAKAKVSSTWNSRAARRKAPPLDELPLESRWS